MPQRDHTWPGLGPDDYIPSKNDIVGTVNRAIQKEGIIKVNHVASSVLADDYKIQSVTWYCINRLRLTWEWVWLSHLQQWALGGNITIRTDEGNNIVDEFYAYNLADVIECIEYVSQAALSLMDTRHA